jgi:predicted MFS family arabinose efflux permease
MTGAAISGSRGGWAVVAVMALGFGLVGIDRFLIATLYPVIARDLGLSYGDIGTITGALAVAWGIAALFMGNLSDRIGRRVVLVGALIMFSLLIGASGLATGLLGLVAVRIVMGFADGAFAPASISATLEAAPPEKQGFSIGLQQMTLTLFGLGLAPLAVGELLHIIDWRWIFSLFVIPGLLLAWVTLRVVPRGRADGSAQLDSLRAWREVLRFGNVRVLMVGMFCWLTCLITTSAFMPSYLMDHLGLGFGPMGRVMSAIGFGATAGTLLLPWLSDAIGRKPVMLLSAAGASVAMLFLSRTGPDPATLFWLLFAVHFFNNALITLTVGPICFESVPAGLTATASGVVIAVGELAGGGLAPILAGQFAEIFGIRHLLWLPMGALAVGFLVCLVALRETRPRGPGTAIRGAASA